MTAPLLDVRNLSIALPKGADRAYAVEGLNITVNPGEITCVVGESGSGKSLTARAAMGLLPPKVEIAGGEILFEGRDLLTLPANERRLMRGEKLSMIFQEPMTALNPLMTVGKQIDEVLTIHTRLGGRARREKILDLFNEVSLPNPKRIAAAYPHQLSGGQRQRAMIAMALILDPKILVADEPTTALDVTTQAQILRLIRELQEKHGTGVMFITHDFGVVAEIADQIVVMQHGKLVEAGKADQILNDPQAEYTKALIGAVPSLTPRPPRTKFGRRMLTVDKLNKVYRSGGGLFGKGTAFHAAKDVSFTLDRGETLGVVGESGSGKTTVARCLVRLLQPDTGRIDLDGIDLAPMSKGQLKPYRNRVQMVFQDPYASLNPRRRVADILVEGPITQGKSAKAAHERARELLDLVGLDPKVAERYPHEFSGGQRQRIGLARALALEPEVLVADEPVSALDVSVQAQVLKLMDEIRERFGLSVVFITHDLRVAAQVCDKIIVMQRGEVVEAGLTAEVFAAPRHAYTKELFASIPGREWSSRGDGPAAAAAGA
ncbi:microcin ABC transporter ATP-binding protein [Acuticoccus sediminis]|uniref:Microcin ABC transporter ATP-binding protein n=1 Tax=Acuticoccus sediminis TaxID=2184697 RepID=A0A8B2NXL1_9HYPH|nr:ABC transporter ATP-binding protein [Acuticoccus sediminis]RAI03420.1 microcin ABC transporter ATP-binding protein [Acuticoccus sediminis]